jgi:phosphoglycolate phosphatase
MSAPASAGVDAVLFDLDGTLVDSRADIALSVNHTLTTLGFPPISMEEVQRHVGDGVRQLLTRSAGPLDPPTMERALAVFLPHYLEHCVDTTRLYPGVADTLDGWNGKALGVVTNKPEAHTQKTLRATGLTGRFRAVLGAETLPQKKPSPEPLWEALKRLGVPKERALMVGDSLIDIHAARAAGVRVAAVTYGFRPAAELRAAAPDFLLDRFDHLQEVVR